MSPFIIHEYPKWAERIVRAIRILGYGFAANTGAAALIFTPTSLRPEMFAVVGSMLLFGLVCFTAAILKRYIIEWVALFFLAAGTSTYVAAVWISTLYNPKATAGASIFSFLICLMVIRIVDLTVYWRRNVTAARLAEELDL